VPLDDPDVDADPGRLVGLADGGVALVCAARSRLRLIQVQPDGRSPLDVADALNGRQIAVGDRLEPIRSR
jgi:methionyl-tRNA formyltransferase